MKRDFLVHSWLCALALLWSCAPAKLLTSRDAVREAIAPLAPRRVVLDDVPVLQQPNRFTCGVTTLAIVSGALHHDERTPDGLAARYGVPFTHGMSLERMLELLRAELPDHDVALRANGTDRALLADLHEQLLRGVPVPILFGAPNPSDPPWFDLHFSVVYGLDLDRQTALVSNAYGYTEELDLNELLRRTSYADPSRYRPELLALIARPLETNIHYRITDRAARCRGDCGAAGIGSGARRTLLLTPSARPGRTGLPGEPAGQRRPSMH